MLPLEIPQLHAFHPLHVVPDMETEDINTTNSDEQFNYHVPVLDSFFDKQVTTESILPMDLELAKFAAENPEVFSDDHVNIHTQSILDNIHDTSQKSMKMLKLDYDEIIAGWNDDKSLRITGNHAEMQPNHCPPGCMVGCDNTLHCNSGDTMMTTIKLDAEREARVSRYKEKRQTRLFSKKIRYEVRKLNAEKRPRMNGRFVKRTSFES
ncbi:zinc finger protein CONSTANS-LIKE 7-like [Bidens hawaiensis]|uniref:zinc finger protein CONSTANS-LIKE 7-like n=1 Tax=Bidens hawaiensis TaxID=980011 RepID=UPI0040491927